MHYNLIDLFAELGAEPTQTLPGEAAPFTAEDSLFAGEAKNQGDNFQAKVTLIADLYSDRVIDFSALPETAQQLFELSVDAFSALVHGWMSELGIKAELLRFGRKVLAARDRDEANHLACNRGDPNVRLVLDIQQKVQHEVHRFQGLLRFSPNEGGVYVACFAPDYLILPALGDYFTQRFGEGTAWAIIDEKRHLCLSRLSNETPQLRKATSPSPANEKVDHGSTDPWVDLWRHYHQTINNESRKNPALQRQFMPKRHWKYLPEMHYNED